MPIITKYFCAPMPDRSCDWCAYFDGREECEVGHGATEEAAKNDLLEQIDQECA